MPDVIVDDTQNTPDTALKNDATPDAPVDDKGKDQDYSVKLAEALKLNKQIEMERNQLKNKLNEQETATLKEKEDYKALAEKLQNDLSERDALDEQTAAQKQTDEVRNDYIAKQPEALQALLKALIESNPSNFLWSNAKDIDDAHAQLDKQAKRIAKAANIKMEDAEETDTTDKVHRNNPTNPNLEGTNYENMSWQDMEKLLPHAPSR